MPEYWEGGTIPWLSLKDIKTLSGRWITETMDRPTQKGIDNSSARLLPRGTVAFCRTASVGKVAILGTEMATSQDFVNWVCGPDLDPDYLYYALRSSGAFFDATKDGTTHKTIYMPTVQRFRILLPPLPEQKRIAAILDKADAIRRKRQEAIKLTEELLRSAFLEMFGNPVTNPKGWSTESLGALAKIVGGGTPARKNPAYYTGNICWATSKDMKGEQLLDTQEHITEEAISRSATKLVAPGTILVVVKSKVLMHRLPVLVAEVPTCFGQDLKGIVIEDARVSATYLARHLRLAEGILLARARGVNTEGLTLDHLRSLQVMLPPTDRTRAYDKLERRVRAILLRMRSAEPGVLFQSCVQRAFRGVL